MAKAEERRTAPRVRSRRFATEFGEVINVSGSGMAVLHRGAAVSAGDTLRLAIGWSGRIAQVDCEVLRVERAGFRRQTVGLRWIEPPEGLWEWLRGARTKGQRECRGPLVYRRRLAA